MNKEYKSPDVEITFLDNDTNASLTPILKSDEGKDWSDPIVPNRTIIE